MTAALHDGQFAPANNQNVPISLKLPDTVTMVLKQAAGHVQTGDPSGQQSTSY
jgi:hypothetical protein